MYVTYPAIKSHVSRAFTFHNARPEVVGDAIVLEMERPKVTKLKAGAHVKLTTAAAFACKKRMFDVEPHPELHYYGVCSYQRHYESGTHDGKLEMWFDVKQDLDLSAIPYLFKLYICDRIVNH